MEVKSKIGIVSKPMGLVLYAQSGLGKTTFLGDMIKSSKNGILFQCGENALGDLNKEWASSIPHYENVLGDYYELRAGEDDSNWSDDQKAARGWEWFKDDLIKYLMLNDHGFTNIAFDSFDNLINRNLDAYVTLKHYQGNVKKANEFGGAKLKEMYSELTTIIHAFEYIQKRGISISLSFHAQSINFKDPANPDYKKWSLGIPAREDYNLRNLFINWSSVTLFGTKEIDVEKKKATGGKHVIKSKDDVAYEAKCRYDIPETLEFNCESFKQAVVASTKKGN